MDFGLRKRANLGAVAISRSHIEVFETYEANEFSKTKKGYAKSGVLSAQATLEI